MTRLTRKQVADARRRYARREATAAVLAAELDVSVSAVKHAVTGRTWAHLTDPPPIRKGRPSTWRGRSTTVTPSILLAIFDDRRGGATWRSIGERHRLDHTVVFRAYRVEMRRRAREAGLGPHHRKASDAGRLRELWADRALTVQEIAAQLGVCNNTVLARAARMGLPPRRVGSRNARRSAAETLAARLVDQARLRELWANPSRPLADIAAALGVDRKTVTTWASDMGLSATPRPARPDTRRAAEKDRAQRRLRELWPDQTLTTTQIAEALGLARGTVSAWAAEMGLPERPRGRRRSRPEREPADQARSRTVRTPL